MHYVHYAKQRHHEGGHFVHEKQFHKRDFAALGKEIGKSRNNFCNGPWPREGDLRSYGDEVRPGGDCLLSYVYLDLYL